MNSDNYRSSKLLRLPRGDGFAQSTEFYISSHYFLWIELEMAFAETNDWHHDPSILERLLRSTSAS